MSDQWLQQSKNVLDMLNKFLAQEESDRLQLINAMLIALNILDRSLQGWRQWVQNLTFMSRFTQTELQEIERGLIKSVSAFIQYDMAVTQQHRDKIPRIKFRIRRRPREAMGGFIA